MIQDNTAEKIVYKKIALVMTVLFLISLLPILYCSFFDYATGDDLWEGAAAYRVLAEGGGVKKFFAEVFDWAKGDYYWWEGNWSSIILWCLEPSIWGEKVYCITPWLSLIFLCGGSAYFLFYFLKKYLKASSAYVAVVAVTICFFSVQYMPYIKGGIFWYTGMVNYVVPYGLCLASFVWLDKFAETGIRRYYVFLILFYAYLGGAGYTPVVLGFEILFLFIVFNMFSHDSRCKRRAFRLLLPFALLTAGFIFSAMSPGNAVRGGETYYFSMGRVFGTIRESIKQGFFGIGNWFISVRPLFLTLPLMAVATWEEIDVDKAKLSFRFPVLVVLFLFLISCSVYAPGIYAQSEVSGGVPDSIYFVFLITCIFSVIYLTCFMKKLLAGKERKFTNQDLTGRIRIVVIVGEVVFCIAAGRHLVGNMTAYVCTDFIRSGQLRDFEFQMQERLKILNDPEIRNAVLPEMNDEQGPFMHMALVNDPKAYTNQATARFYGKESVIAIPRTEYYELYGYPDEGKEE